MGYGRLIVQIWSRGSGNDPPAIGFEPSDPVLSYCLVECGSEDVTFVKYYPQPMNSYQGVAGSSAEMTERCEDDVEAPSQRMHQLRVIRLLLYYADAEVVACEMFLYLLLPLLDQGEGDDDQRRRR